jgi:hypothetical protein
MEQDKRDALIEAAMKGAKFLDARDPGWAHKVDPITLDMGSGELCVFGQLYGYYFEGLERYHFRNGEQYTYGFSLNADDHRNAEGAIDLAAVNASWEELDIAWEREILARRMGD